MFPWSSKANPALYFLQVSAVLYTILGHIIAFPYTRSICDVNCRRTMHKNRVDYVKRQTSTWSFVHSRVKIRKWKELEYFLRDEKVIRHRWVTYSLGKGDSWKRASKLLVHVPRIDPFDSKWVLRALYGRFIHTYLPTLRTKHIWTDPRFTFLKPFRDSKTRVAPS